MKITAVLDTRCRGVLLLNILHNVGLIKLEVVKSQTPHVHTCFPSSASLWRYPLSTTPPSHSLAIVHITSSPCQLASSWCTCSRQKKMYLCFNSTGAIANKNEPPKSVQRQFCVRTTMSGSQGNPQQHLPWDIYMPEQLLPNQQNKIERS